MTFLSSHYLMLSSGFLNPFSSCQKSGFVFPWREKADRCESGIGMKKVVLAAKIEAQYRGRHLILI